MKTYDLTMSTTEVKPITVDVKDLQDDETVTDATITHTPPSGDATTVTYTVESPYINCLFGPLSVAGSHTIRVQAIGSAGSKPEVLFEIEVS